MSYLRHIYNPVYSKGWVSKFTLFRKLSFLMLDFGFRTIKLHITNQCNLSCKTCYNKATAGVMESSHVFSLLDQLRQEGRSLNWRLDILGGEPLLREDFYEIITHAKKKAGIKTVQVFTNATLINNQAAKKMKEAGVDIAIVPLYSHIPEIHDSITQCRGSWLKARDGIASLLAAGINTYSFIIFVSCNSDKIRELESFTRSLGTKPIFFPYIKQHICDDLYISDKDKYQHLINYAFKNSGKHRKQTLARAKCRGKLCRAFVHTVTIKADGTITPCPFVDLSLGNIQENKFYSILHGAYNNKELLDFLSIPEECFQCTCVDICGGGCKSYNYQLHNNTKDKDINCRGPFNKTVPDKDLGMCLPYFA